MYVCPNCAGNIKYDIHEQMLHCAHCGFSSDPYEFSKEQDAEEQEEYEATIFTCPQCGGEILSEDTTAATFCSFCGAATVLDSRVCKEKRPAYIIPFKKTKDDCKKAYQKLMKRAIYAPKQLKDPENIQKFRGIYMPYGVYALHKEGEVSFRGIHSQRRFNYIYHTSYRLECDILEDFDNITYDLSSSFADDLSISIAPYDMQEKKEFTPSFLSGFYADTSDIDSDIYNVDARSLVLEEVTNKIVKNRKYRKYTIEQKNLMNAFNPSTVTSKLVLLPVWFLACRDGNRISYAVVNGQTGKAGADIPIDMKKILFGSLITTIPIFFILNIFFTFTPAKLLWIVILLAILFEGIIAKQIVNLDARDTGKNDKGFSAKFLGKRRSYKEDEEQMIKHTKKKTDDYIYLCIISSILFILTQNVIFIIFLMPIVFLGIVSFSKFTLKFFQVENKEKSILWVPCIGILGALMTIFLHPINDIFYYGTVVFCLITLICTMKDMIKLYNKMVTRKLPLFNKRGGDENA